jgi:signal peptidase I
MELQRQECSTGDPARARNRLKPETRQGHILLCLALWSTIMFLFIHRFIIATVVVQGQSMSPTLQPGDRLYVNCWMPHIRGYRQGDLVVIRDRDRNELMVKRIVGLPGDRIQLREGRVYVNDRVLDEPYLAGRPHTYSRQIGRQTVVVGKDSFFVLGDNRLNSEDSRLYGDVDRSDLVGVIQR